MDHPEQGAILRQGRCSATELMNLTASNIQATEDLPTCSTKEPLPLVHDTLNLQLCCLIINLTI